MTKVVDLIGRRAIDQGARLDVVVVVSGDYSTGVFSGGVYPDAGGAPLGDFSFEAPTFNPTTGNTTAIAYMLGALTATFPIDVELRYVVRSQLPGYDPVRLQQGRAQVNGSVIERPDDTGIGRLTTAEQRIEALEALVRQLRLDVDALQGG